AYLAVVREWGQSLESADTYTFGHCERVAQLGVAVARALGLDEHAQTTVRLGAYLHDLGKVRVPHEILSKPGPLTRDEFEVVQMHPIWGSSCSRRSSSPGISSPSSAGTTSATTGPAIPTACAATRSRCRHRSWASWTCTTLSPPRAPTARRSRGRRRSRRSTAAAGTGRRRCSAPSVRRWCSPRPHPRKSLHGARKHSSRISHS